jgi:hypothetical protein
MRSPNESPDNKEVMGDSISACTNACTNKSEIRQETDLDALAAALQELSAEERATLAAMLLEN